MEDASSTCTDKFGWIFMEWKTKRPKSVSKKTKGNSEKWLKKNSFTPFT